MRAAVACAILQECLAQTIALPPPTGKYYISVSKHTIENYNPNDPLAPNNISTEFLATIYYPTFQKPVGPPQPYLEPELAARLEPLLNYNASFLSTFTSTIQQNAPFVYDVKSAPTLLFGPGGSAPSVLNSIVISEMASHGYTVVALDHPFEQPFIRYPNGTAVMGVDIDFAAPGLIEALYNTRLVDNAAFMEYFPKLTHTLGAPFNTTHFGLFGFSLGGAAAIGSAHNDHVVSVLNLDGAVWGVPALNNSQAGRAKPVFLLGNENHTTENYMYDPSWQSFLRWQTGYSRLFTIKGSMHLDFSDLTFWKIFGPPNPLAGRVDGSLQLNIVTAYVKAFFDFTLLGQDSPLLDGSPPEWPEVTFHDHTA
ncbi:hypothetical protein RRF57_001668 [Xylaria bambusicola]|uniref:1-alkyl-2-acetylglycerophosphocholine esterase n=1 Tax=Xylaria bambusicola TaxID=326684 RepID=A0AAN7Z110_9PEZI